MLTTSMISTASIGGRARALLLAGFAALPLLGAASIVAQAQPAPGAQMHCPGHGEGIEQRVDNMLKRANATPDQTTKVHAIVQAAKTDIEPMRAAMRDSHKQMRTLLGAPQIDAAAIETLRAKESATRDQMSRRVSAATIEAANVLTPDQRAKLATMAPDRGPNRPN
jgi:protein CpxP